MLFFLALLEVFTVAYSISSYTIYCDGTCDKDTYPPVTERGVVLMGGGTDTNEAFTWQIQNANRGDFVVIRTSGDDAYNEYLLKLSVTAGAKLHSVRTIVFNSRDASSEPEVLTTLRNAEATFMAGGDQSVYMDYWAGTEVQTILQEKLANITIGGTSAGCAVLGNWVYTGEVDSVDSAQALANPYNDAMTIAPKFLTIPYLESFITDTHFGKKTIFSSLDNCL
jgi:cyanophycinase